MWMIGTIDCERITPIFKGVKMSYVGDANAFWDNLLNNLITARW